MSKLIHTHDSELVALRELKVLWGNYKTEKDIKLKKGWMDQIKERQKTIKKHRQQFQPYKYRGLIFRQASKSPMGQP
jgi:hypothetical protein